MEVGDVAAWFAAGVAIIAAFIAMSNANSAKTQAGAALKQAHEAELARKAAEESAVEARKANEFLRDKDAREQAERDAAAVSEASKVRLNLTNNSGVLVEITNHSSQPMFDVTIEDVLPTEDPSYKWRFNPRYSGVREAAPALPPGTEESWPVVFEAHDGEESRTVGQFYDVTFTFTDGDRQRWRRKNSDPPVRVSVDEERVQHQNQAAGPPSEEKLRTQVLHFIVKRKQNGMLIDVDELPTELGLDETLVQRCLEHLRSEGLIIATRGDDRVAGISGPTPGGVRAIEELGL